MSLASSRLREPVIDAEQLALRSEEARKQAELIARQVEEIKQKKARKKTGITDEVKQKEEESKGVSGEASALEKQVPPISAASDVATQSETAKKLEPDLQTEAQSHPGSTDGTLHKPIVKPEEKADKKKKQAKQQVVWKDESTKKRGVKTRGDLSAGQGWRTRRDKHSKPAHVDDQNIHGFSAPTEPIVREYDGARNNLCERTCTENVS